MNHTVRFLTLVSLLSITAVAEGQERVAQLSKVAGEVTVKRAADGRIDTAKQAGPRVTNGSLFPGDVVATAAGATASVLFSDGSSLDVAEKSALSVREVDQAAAMAAGQADKPTGRRIRMLAGTIAASISANAQVATAFETPSGVASVKGTKLRISIGSN